MIDIQSSGQDTAELARLLKEARAAKGWTLREAAAQTKISNGYLSLIEQGEVKSPTPRYLLSLAAHYELPFDRLMALAGHPSGPSPVSSAHASTTVAARAGGAKPRQGATDWPTANEVVSGPAGVVAADMAAPRETEPGEDGAWASVEPVLGVDTGDVTASTLTQADADRYPDLPRERSGEQAFDRVSGRETGAGDVADRRQLAALVVDDLRALSTGDIAQVRAFIAGLRAARRS